MDATVTAHATEGRDVARLDRIRTLIAEADRAGRPARDVLADIDEALGPRRVETASYQKLWG